MQHRALIVDDSRVMRSILRHILFKAGFEVVEAANGSEALAQIRSAGTLDVALLDWNMPEVDGLTVLQAIRADRAFDGLRVMMVTSETDVRQVATALTMGADEYIMKPFNEAAMLEKLALLLEWKPAASHSA